MAQPVLTVVPDAPPAHSSEAEPFTEALGDVIGSYRLESLLGAGAMGRVFLGRHIRLDRAVALKVLHPRHIRDPELVKRFLQEARTVNQINHHHIVEVHDFVEELMPERVYCVMELLTGKTLAQRLAAGPLTIAQATTLCRQIADGLGAAHQVGVVHRDVKPDNIFLTSRQGQHDFVKVLDFGVARVVKQLSEATTLDTMSGAVVGTPRYMSPEQAAGLEVDHRSDIYALGTILYEMLSGQPPFSSPTFGALTAEIITRPPPPLPAKTPGGEPIPASLRALVTSCLAKEAAKRPQTMADFTAGLGGGAPASAPRPSQRNVVLLAAAVVVAVAGVAGALAVVRGGQAPQAPAQPPPAAAVLAAPIAQAPKPPARVTISVSSTPPGATVRRKDTRAVLGKTPLDLDLARADGTLPLVIELADHEPMEKAVRLDGNGAIDVTLTPKARRKAAPAATHDGVLDPFAE